MTKPCFVLALLALALVCGRSDGAKILAIFPTPSFSHQQPLLAVTRALAVKGHDLTVVTTNPSKTLLKNHRELDVSSLYKILDDLKKETGFSTQERSKPFKFLGEFPDLHKFLISKQFETPQIQELIREVNGTKFDLILYEALMYSCFLGFKELVGDPPVVGLLTVHPFVINDVPLGNPLIPSYMPNVLLQHDSQMTFSERATNFLFNIYFEYQRTRRFDPIQEEFLKNNFGNVRRTAYELERSVSLTLITADLATGYSKPVHPNTVYVGPTHITKPPPLPEDIQKWMDEAEEGVIYFSLGSNMKGKSVPEEKRAAFNRAFSQFPRVRVLWKWEADTKLPGQPDNVLVKKWLPQQSVLAHPNLRLFISQVGLQSFQEMTTFGVPVLGIPMFGDQDWNAKKTVHAGAGRTLEFADITYDTVYENLKELLTNKSYKENMERLSRITKDKPMPAVETAIWWIEYVLRHNGASHLRPSSLDLTWYEYENYDVVAVLLAALLMVLYLIYSVLKKAVSSVTGETKIKTS